MSSVIYRILQIIQGGKVLQFSQINRYRETSIEIACVIGFGHARQLFNRESFPANQSLVLAIW